MLLVDVLPESRLQEDDVEPCVSCPALAHALDSNDSKDVASYPAAHATSTLNSAAFSSVVVMAYPVVSLGSVQMTSSHPLMVSSRDGYISILNFADGELGEKYVPALEAAEAKIVQEEAAKLASRPMVPVPRAVNTAATPSAAPCATTPYTAPSVANVALPPVCPSVSTPDFCAL